MSASAACSAKHAKSAMANAVHARRCMTDMPEQSRTKRAAITKSDGEATLASYPSYSAKNEPMASRSACDSPSSSHARSSARSEKSRRVG